MIQKNEVAPVAVNAGNFTNVSLFVKFFIQEISLKVISK